MKKSIRFLCTIMALVFCLTLFAACANDSGTQTTPGTTEPAGSTTTDSGTPAASGGNFGSEEYREFWLTEEPVTFNVATLLAPNWGHPTEGSFWKWLEEYTNISVNWTTFLAAEQEEQFALMMASQELPDIFMGTFGGGTANLLLYGSELGVYIPLNDLIQNYAPNFLRRGLAEDPNLLSMLTAPDGNIYSLPLIHPLDPRVYNATAINQLWLDNLGLEVPTTIEEVEDVLIAFRDGDPNGDGSTVIPMSFNFSCWGAADFSWWYGPFGGPLSNDLILIENGQVTYQGAQDYFRDGTRWLASLYEQGLVDVEVFTYDEPSYRARAGSTPPSFGIWSSWSPWADAGPNNDLYTTLLQPIEGPGGAHVLWEEVVSFSRDVFQISSAASNPELIMRWVDIFYQDVETSLRASRGPGPGQAWFYTDDGLIQWVEPLPEEYIRGMNEHPFAPGIIGSEYAALMAPPLVPDLKALHVENVLEPYATNFFNGTWNRWPITFMEADEADEISFIEADLLPFTRSMQARWIAGESDIDADWDQYLRDLDSYGLQRWLEIRQQVYNRFIAG